ncbi:unnamed protein product [Rotaria sordida]|nr:unnamed protein product [Rotaria sordida]CAF0901100.1 unnamed protein product [Rotaria sordida]CAF0945514.1 unnamed protein product [Rotaria sordida]CAF1085351.1 unnamed protein product [Rotaria sordida]CAF3503209.1 unnamed protein product [Rotaria sordida]
MIKTEVLSPEIAAYPISSSENSLISFDANDIIEFGPIKVKRRKKPAPTLATGRRSKYEILSPEEEHKRDIRRARNRVAAERVRVSRLCVEQQLQGQIDALQEQEQKLLNHIEILQSQKLNLETRVFTHEKLCPIRSLSNAQDHLTSTFISNSVPISTTIQQIEQTSEPYFEDLFPNSTPLVQTQPNNYSNSLTTTVSGDDFDMFFMDL